MDQTNREDRKGGGGGPLVCIKKCLHRDPSLGICKESEQLGSSSPPETPGLPHRWIWIWIYSASGSIRQSATTTTCGAGQGFRVGCCYQACVREDEPPPPAA